MIDSTDDDAPTCRDCGEPVKTDSSHRIASTVEDGKAVHLYFCTDDCFENWDD